jgi:hypothetical protein
MSCKQMFFEGGGEWGGDVQVDLILLGSALLLDHKRR